MTEATAVAVTVPTPPAQLTGSMTELETWADSLVITSPEQCTEAVEKVSTIKGWKSKVVDFFAKSKKAAHDTHKEIVRQEKSLTDVADRVESKAKAAIVKYNRQEEERREAERRRLQAEADERARKEREKLEREAERLKTPELKEARLEQAAAVVAPVVNVEAAPPVAGLSTRKTWKAKVVDAALIPREWLTPDLDALNGFAKATKGIKPIPGVEFYEEVTAAIGRQ